MHTHTYTYTQNTTKKTSLGQFFTKDFNKVQTQCLFLFLSLGFVIVVVGVFFFLFTVYPVSLMSLISLLS